MAKKELFWARQENPQHALKFTALKSTSKWSRTHPGRPTYGTVMDFKDRQNHCQV
jgi:hypothetical protein